MNNNGICQTRNRMIAFSENLTLEKSKAPSMKSLLGLPDDIYYMLNPFPSTNHLDWWSNNEKHEWHKETFSESHTTW